MKKFLYYFFAFMAVNVSAVLGQNTASYKVVDENVAKLGSLDGQNVANITVALTKPFQDKELQTRAIFYWIANNISLDAKAIKINDERKSLPEDVVKYRKGTSLGIAKLFQEMSSLANIRCLVVDGYVKKTIDDLNNPADEINHTWNVVQLGLSPEKWFFVDAAKAMGTLDKKMSGFKKEFTSEYFFADRNLFNLDHFPDNDAWQMGGGPKNLKEFYSLPVISSAAYFYGLNKPTPTNGYIKTKISGKTTFNLPYSFALPITNVSLLIGDGVKQQKPEPMNFTVSANKINFSYQFKKEDTYPVKIIVDGKTVLEYMVEVSE